MSRKWHETVMAVSSRHVRHERANAPRSVAVRGPSLTHNGRAQAQFMQRVAISQCLVSEDV